MIIKKIRITCLEILILIGTSLLFTVLTQLVSRILENLSEDSELYGDTCETLLQCMLERIVDKIPCVRVQAITALLRLQVLTRFSRFASVH